MDAISLRQFQALWQLKLRLLLRFWQQRDAVYRWTMVISVVFSTLLALGLGATVGWLIYQLAALRSEVSPDLLKNLWLGMFLCLSFVWILSPLLFILKNESLTLDISRLTRFPIAYRSLHFFHTLLALIDPWTLFFYPLVVGVVSAMLAHKGLSVLGGSLTVLLLWVLVQTAWSRLIQDLITILFTSRRLREVLSLMVIVAVIMLSFLPALITERTSLEQLSGIQAPSIELFLYQWDSWRSLQPVLNFLLYTTPAGWLSHALNGLLFDQPRWWLEGCLAMMGWIGLAQLLGISLMRRMFSEPTTVAFNKRINEALFSSRWQLPGLSDQTRIMVLKELRTYFRSILGKLSFFLTPLLVVILRLVGMGASGDYAPASLLLGMTVYVFMTSLFLYINYFGSDGEGFKLYLLAETPPRQLILAKNLALGLFACAEFSLVLVLYVLLYRQPNADIILFGLGAFVALLMGVLAMGNILSLRFASNMDLNQTQYRQSNGTPILLALQVLSTLALLISLGLWLGTSRHEPLWLVGLTLAALMSLGWWLLLPFSEQLWYSRRWEILNQVTQKE